MIGVDSPWWFSLLVSTVALFFCFWSIISSCKTVILTPEVCQIRFWFWHKEYRWDELQTKRYVDYSKYVNWSAIIFWSVNLTDKTFECSPRVHKKHKRIPSRYAFFHPFSYVIICLHHEKPPKFSNDTYLVDIEQFKNKLAEWGVEIETLL